MERDRRIFLLLAFGLSWAVAGAGALAGVDATSGGAYMLVASGFMLGPALAAIILTVLVRRRPWSALGLGFRAVRWKAVMWTALVGLALVPVMLMVSWVGGHVLGLEAFGDVELTQERLASSIAAAAEAAGQDPAMAGKALVAVRLPGVVWLLVFMGTALLAALTVNVPAMLGEELGWRGVLYGSCMAWPAWKRILFTGVVWGVWHAPVIAMGHNYGEHRAIGIPLMVGFCLLLAVLFDRSRTRSGSVWSAVLLHGLINGSAGAFAMFTKGGHPLVASPVGAAGFIGIALVTVVVLVLDGGSTVDPGASAGDDRPSPLEHRT